MLGHFRSLRGFVPRMIAIACLVPVLAAIVISMAPRAAHAQEPTARPDDKQQLTLDRYMEMEGVRNPRLSPDGSRIAYERRWIDPMTDSRKSALWIVNGDGSNNRFLTDGSAARWSPSGDRLAFISCGAPGGEPDTREECPEGSERQVYVRIMSGDGEGSITQVTRLTENASNPSWSPDGTHIAFTSFVPKPDMWSIELPVPPEGAQWTGDPVIVDDVWYRRDRRGILRNGHDHIFVVPTTGGTPKRVTPELYDHEDIYGGDAPEWSPNGRTIYFDGLTNRDADYRWTTGGYGHMETEIFAVHVETGEVRQLTDRKGTDRAPRVSPDGRLIAYTGVDSTSKSYIADDLYVMNANGSNPRNLTTDFDRRPRNHLWAPDGKGVYFTAESEGTENLYFASLEGSVRPVTEGTHELATTHITRNGTAVGVLSTPHIPEDVVVFSLRHPELRIVTHVNDDILADVELGDVEEIWYEAPDGLRIQGWIVKPPDFDPSRRYPLILSIHGGPHGMYDVGFSYSFQNWAANGYVVLYTNPRGSTGYGSEFGNLIEKQYPGPDFQDLMAGVDAVLEKGYVDPENLFVTGCSGGGTLTAWAVGHTNRFAAAAARCPISNWISFMGTVDGPYWYNWFKTFPWEDATEHLNHSPLMYADEVTTPTLLMTGVKDLRTPISQAEEFYQALKMERVPTKLIRMEGEWHGTTSKPSNFLRTQLYVMKWFEEWMTEPMRRRIATRIQ